MVKFTRKFYITTPIYYVNGKPHIGHVFTTVVADCIARWKRILGFNVFFLTGTDEHGIKNQKAAENIGMKVEEFVDKMSEEFKKLWKVLNISHNFFIRTSDKKIHYPTAQEIWKRIKENGDIYKKKYRGYYCSGCEAFVTEKDLIDGKCPFHGKEPEVVEEENYFFKLSKYAEKVGELIEKDEIKIIPEARKHEILSFIKQGVEDVSFSRSKSRVYWGIPVPEDDSQVMYVWCDALTNYLSGIGFTYDKEKFEKFWPADLHIIGKEILRFHALIWPAMLISAGLPLPKKILAHGFITSGGKKMSKTLGNVIEPVEYIKEFGADALRYYLLREISTQEDGDFTRENFIRRYNADLADNLGNLVRRVFVLIQKYFDGKIPKGEKDVELWKKIEERVEVFEKEMEELKLNMACAELWKIFDLTNEYLNKNEPWKRSEIRAKVIRNVAEGLRVSAILLYPFMPTTAEKILSGFYLGKEHIKIENIEFGKLKEGEEVRIPKVFFEKVEEDEFSKLDLKIGKIVKVEDVENAEKLYKISVDLGKEKRTLVAGIKNFYSKEELLGKKIVVLCNLKPKKIFGILSQGMLLACETKSGEVSLLTCDAEIGRDVYVEGIEKNPSKEISLDEFLSLELKVKDGIAYYKDKMLLADGQKIVADKPVSGKIR